MESLINMFLLVVKMDLLIKSIFKQNEPHVNYNRLQEEYHVKRKILLFNKIYFIIIRCQSHQLMKFLSDDDDITEEDQTHINFIQDSLIKSKLLVVTTKDDKTLLDNNSKQSNQVN